jgi:hypothetical protein
LAPPGLHWLGNEKCQGNESPSPSESARFNYLIFFRAISLFTVGETINDRVPQSVGVNVQLNVL